MKLSSYYWIAFNCESMDESIFNVFYYKTIILIKFYFPNFNTYTVNVEKKLDISQKKLDISQKKLDISQKKLDIKNIKQITWKDYFAKSKYH